MRCMRTEAPWFALVGAQAGPEDGTIMKYLNVAKNPVKIFRDTFRDRWKSAVRFCSIDLHKDSEIF